MFKSRVFLCILGLLLCLCTTSEARVCFLASGTDASGNATNCIGGGVIEDFIEIEAVACPDKEECTIPKLNAASCSDNGTRFYDPVDCCTNTSIYEVCAPEFGYVCAESSCEGIDSEGEKFVSCPIGNCVCGAEFTETCDGIGQKGVGIACDGKYKSCECDKSRFFKCGANSTPSGATCSDSTGTYHASCECPATDGDNWVSNPDECCSVSSTTCVSRPDGKTVYKCNPDPVFTCQCGYTYSKAGCQSGCTDSTFNYFGSSSNVVCAGGYIPYLNSDTGICGNGCTCAVGYWDYYETCNQSDDTICAQLGYTETACSGDYISCPFDSSAKKCLDIVVEEETEGGCEYANQIACEVANKNSVCAQGTDGCFAPTSCRAGFYKTLDEVSCPDGQFNKVGGADANGCGYCASEYTTCVEAGYADSPIANGVRKTIYLADGTIEENCFATKSQVDCEDAFYNSKCEENEDGEWVHTGCKVPSVTTCPDSGRLAVDMAGCATCESKCLYVDESACTAKNKNSVCEPDGDGCYVPTICAQRSYTEVNDTNCGDQGRYYDKLVDIDANGCGKCGSSYTSCEDWGYIDDTWSHTGGDAPSNVGAGSAFQFWTSEGTVRECWALDVDCAYSSSSDCTTKNPNGKCSLKNGCYELASCNKNYALMNGKCERIYPGLEDCERDNPGFVCEKVWSESGYGEGYHYAPNGTCKEGYTLTDDACIADEIKYTTMDECANANPNAICALKTDSQGNEYYGLATTCDDGGFSTQEDCEATFVNSTCARRSSATAPDNCFIASGCKEGFAQTCATGTTLKQPDAFGCGPCCKYTSLYQCQTANPNGQCDTGITPLGNTHGCYIVTLCDDGYTLEDGKCVEQDGRTKYNTLEECEVANIMNKCESDGNGKYVATTCLDGAYDDGTCKGVDDDWNDCKMDYYSSPCEEDGKGYYVPVNCPRTKATCEAEYIYSNCIKTSEANCWIPSSLKYPTPSSDYCKGEGYKWTGGHTGAQFCIAPTVEDCERVYPGFKCQHTTEFEGGYIPTGCASGYTFDSGYCIEDATNLCPDGEFTTLEVCDAHNNNSVCGPSRNAGCFALDFCKTGYRISANCPNGEIVSPDDLGCGYCAYSTKELCLANSNGFACTSLYTNGKSYYAIRETSCADGYTLSNGACVANCEYANEGECETTNFNSDCTQVGGCFVPTTCTYGAAKEFDTTKCRSQRYYATKLVEFDPAGCGICGSDYTTCDALGYLVSQHGGGTEDIGAGREFLFFNNKGIFTDCWILDGTCAYDTLENCQANASACQYNMGCYEATSCPDGYTLTEGACVADKVETCEDYNAYTDRSACNSACKGDHPLCEPENVTTKSGATITCTVCNPQCDWVDKAECEKYKVGYACTLTNGCWNATTTCKEGYALMNGKCERIYSALADCEAAHPGFVCEKVWYEGAYGEGYYYASNGTCKTGYKLENDKCVSTVTCSSGQVFVNGVCHNIETCEQHSLVPLSTEVTPLAEQASGGDVKTVYNAQGEAITCTCNGTDNYISSYACQYNNKQATCGLADNGCYEVIMCNDGYELVNGKCVADDGCLVSDYPEFETALSNSACTTVTLAADINGTGDSKTGSLSMLANQTLDGSGYKLTLNRTIYPSSRSIIKNINLINNTNAAIFIDVSGVTLSDINVQSSNKAIKTDEATDINMTGYNTITAYGNGAIALATSDFGDFTLAQGATLDIEVSGSDSIAITPFCGSGGYFINGTMNITSSDGYAVYATACGSYIYVNGELNINHRGSKNAISLGGGSAIIEVNGRMNINSTSTADTIDFPRDSMHVDFAIAGTLDIKAPIASGKYFINAVNDLGNVLTFTSSNAKLITTSTGSRTLSDTDAGVNLILSEAKKGATWQVKSSGFNKTWEAQQDYTGQTAVIKAPQSPYWCDATTGCASAATCTYTSESNCESKNFNSVCTIVSGCYEPTSCEPNNYRNETECKQKTGAYSCQMKTQDPYGCGQAILITFG